MARFVVEVVEGLALRDLVESYAGRGSAAYPPQMLVSQLFYGYATGVFASRKLETGTCGPTRGCRAKLADQTGLSR